MEITKYLEKLKDWLYQDIGVKIKYFAFYSFLAEAIGTIITGFILVLDEYWWGFLLLFLGPIVAWSASWLLYGFGEIVDKVCHIEYNTQRIFNNADIDKDRTNSDSKTIHEKSSQNQDEKEEVVVADAAKEEENNEKDYRTFF